MPLASQAATGFLDSLQCINQGSCGLDDIATGFVELIKLLLGIMGAVALVYFVWGGIVWITSGGNMEKISRGRNIMINTILAIMVSFSSYIILGFFVNDILGANQKFQVSAECSQAADGSPCRGDVYKCYRGACLTKCDIVNKKILAMPASNAIPPINTITIQPENKTFQRGDSFACEDVANTNQVAHFEDYCPGNANFVCVFRRHGATQPPPLP